MFKFLTELLKNKEKRTSELKTRRTNLGCKLNEFWNQLRETLQDGSVKLLPGKIN